MNAGRSTPTVGLSAPSIGEGKLAKTGAVKKEKYVPVSRLIIFPTSALLRTKLKNEKNRIFFFQFLH